MSVRHVDIWPRCSGTELGAQAVARHVVGVGLQWTRSACLRVRQPIERVVEVLAVGNRGIDRAARGRDVAHHVDAEVERQSAGNGAGYGIDRIILIVGLCADAAVRECQGMERPERIVACTAHYRAG